MITCQENVNVQFDLLNRMCSDLNIQIDDEHSVFHLVYTYIGITILNLIYNAKINGEGISSSSVKHQTQEKVFRLMHLLNISDEQLDPSTLIESVIDVFKRSGFLYFRKNLVFPAPTSVAKFNDIELIRTCNPLNHHLISGTGFYRVISESVAIPTDFNTFGIEAISLTLFVDALLKESEWKDDICNDSFEYLSLWDYKKGYWSAKPKRNFSYTLARSGSMTKTYYFCQCDQGKMRFSKINDANLFFPLGDRKNQDYYRLIANGLIMKYGSFPFIYWSKISSQLIRVRISFLLPPSLQALFMLYSWPYSYKNETLKFNRVMSIEIFNVLSGLFSKFDYIFVEE